MKQTVRIVSIPEPGIAEVFLERESACSGDCHQCSGCGAVRETLFVRAENPIGAGVGAMVEIETATKTVMKAAFLVYLVPVLLFFVGYWLGDMLSFLPGWFGAALFALGVIPAVVLNRRLDQKNKSVFRITGYAQES